MSRKTKPPAPTRPARAPAQEPVADVAATQPAQPAVAVLDKLRMPTGAKLIALALCAFFLLLMFHHYAGSNSEIWPDTGCQAYYAWRVANGTTLYKDVWEPHPPAVIAFASLFYWILPPTLFTVKLIMFTLAGLIGTITAHAVRRFAELDWTGTLFCGLLMTLLQYTAIVALRPEATLALSSLATVHFALLSFRSSKPYWMITAAGLFAGAALCSKPGGAAAAVIGGLLCTFGTGRFTIMRGVMFAGSAGVLPAAWVLWMLATGSFAPAWDNIVVYGREYFPPFALSRLPGIWDQGIASRGGALVLAVYVAVLASAQLWRRPLMRAIAGGPNRRVFWIVFVAWPALELAATIPQTTGFMYIFDNFVTTLLYLVLVSVAVLATGEITVRAKARVAATYAILGCALFRAKYDDGSIAIVLGVVAAALLWTRTRGPNHAWAGALLMYVMLTPLVAFAKADLRDYFPNLAQVQWREEPEDKFAREKLAVLKQRVGGKLLSFTVSPSHAYLAGWELALPWHVVQPLFVTRGYATADRWREVIRIAESPDTHIMVDWPKWYDIKDDSQRPYMVPEFGEALDRIRRKFQVVKIVDLGYPPVRIWADKASVNTVRAVLDH